MPYAIQVDRAGGPEVMEWRSVETGAPGPGQVLLRNRAIGFNFIDIYFRTGVYPLEYPSGLGSEGPVRCWRWARVLRTSIPVTA